MWGQDLCSGGVRLPEPATNVETFCALILVLGEIPHDPQKYARSPTM